MPTFNEILMFFIGFVFGGIFIYRKDTKEIERQIKRTDNAIWANGDDTP